MRFPWRGCLPLLSVCIGISSSAQTATSSTTLQSVVSRLGAMPADSSANAGVEITAGATHGVGTLKVLTRGASDSVEEWTIAGTTHRSVAAPSIQSNAPLSKNQKFYATSPVMQSALFPLPWLTAKASIKDMQTEDLGSEQADGRSLQHLRLYRVWQPRNGVEPKKITDSEVWLDPSSGLPAKISYRDTDVSTTKASVQVTVEYADYRAVDGVLYPFHTKQYLNGSLWADIQVQDVRFNTGLTDSDFSSK